MYGKIEICNRESDGDIIKIEENKERAEISKNIEKKQLLAKRIFQFY